MLGSVAINGTGNALDNVLIGNAGNNLLAGLAGADRVDGGAGTDTASYAASSAGVSVSLLTGLGSGGDAQGDTLVASRTSPARRSTTRWKATAAPNVLIGRRGNDTLNGGVGADRMLGGLGHDTYVVDNIGDVVEESGGDGTDTVQASISFSLADSVHAIGAVENLTLLGSAAINGTGNALDNVLIGNAGNNLLCRSCAVPTRWTAAPASTRRAMQPRRRRQRQPDDRARPAAAMPKATPSSASRTSPARRSMTRSKAMRLPMCSTAALAPTR